LGDRDGVRTPMQWSIDRNGGFSRADPASLVLPPLMDPLYGYQTINVEAQARDPHSLLNWMRRLLAVRKQQKAFGRGSLKMLTPSNRRVLAYLRSYSGADGNSECVLCVANVSRSAQAVELDLSACTDMVPVEMIGGCAFPPIGQLPYLLTLPPYGFYWFLLAPETKMPSWHVKPVEGMPDFRTLVLKRHLVELLEPPARTVLEQESLLAYLPKRRWFAGKDEPIKALRIAYATPFGDPQRPMLLSEIEVDSAKGSERYQLPLGFIAEEEPSSMLSQQLALARVRRVRQVGLLTDAFTLESFIRAVIQGLHESKVLPSDKGELQFLPTPKLAELELPADAEVRYLSAEQSNSSVVVGGSLVLKLIRRVSPGVHPELEMGGFLTERGFAHISPLLGAVRRIDEGGEEHVLMVAQRYLNNQGDAWEWTQNTLDRAIRDELAGGVSSVENQYSALAELEGFSRLFGQRLGEMHVVLAGYSENPAFGTELTTAEDTQHWARSVGAQVARALDILEQHKQALNEEDRAFVERLLPQRDGLLRQVERLAERSAGGLRMRVHGDLHLGQVLVVQGDAYIIDFEGEPARPLAERRAKHSPLKDVSGVLRSFDYAAAMAIRNAQSADSSAEADHARRLIAEAYRSNARKVFFDAYRLAAADLPHAWHERDGEGAALELFSVEKAAYEIAYEAEHRPTWLSVPLQGLVGLAQLLAEGESS